MISIKKHLSLFLGVIIILFFSTLNNSLDLNRSNFYQSQSEAGIYKNENQFFYFNYYLNLFPLKSKINPTIDDLNKKSAEKKLIDSNNLIMEENHSIRFGGFFSHYLYYFDALIFDNILNPNLKVFNIIFFNFSLILLFVGFYMNKKKELGLIFCFLLMSNPFQVFEVYKHENIFGLMISITLLMGSFFLILKSLERNKRFILFLIIYIVLLAIILNFFYYVRSNVLIFIFPFIISIFFFKTKIYSKIISTVFLIFFLSTTNYLFSNFIDNKINKTKNLIKSLDGKYLDVSYQVHERFFPLYVGLGEYKNNLNIGFWDDYVGNDFILESENIDVSIIMSKKSHNSYNLHPVGFVDNFDEYFKDEIFRILKTDSTFFFKLLFNRISTSLNNLTPITFNFVIGNLYIENVLISKMLLLIYFFILIYWIKKKKMIEIYLSILFSTSLIYSVLFPPTLGLSYYIISHILFFSFLLFQIYKLINKKLTLKKYE